MEATSMSTDRWLDKEDVAHVYDSAIEKNKIVSLSATQMELEIIILSEVSQGEKDKYHVKLLTYGI